VTIGDKIFIFFCNSFLLSRIYFLLLFTFFGKGIVRFTGICLPRPGICSGFVIDKTVLNLEQKLNIDDLQRGSGEFRIIKNVEYLLIFNILVCILLLPRITLSSSSLMSEGEVRSNGKVIFTSPSFFLGDKMGSFGTTDLIMILPILLLLAVGWKLPEICEKVEKVIRNCKNSTKREKNDVPSGDPGEISEN